MLYFDLFEFVIVFFFFKQKTAYEMRISDWSSDVCSSDLDRHSRSCKDTITSYSLSSRISQTLFMTAQIAKCNDSCMIKPHDARYGKIGRASCRERVCQYV